MAFLDINFAERRNPARLVVRTVWMNEWCFSRAHNFRLKSSAYSLFRQKDFPIVSDLYLSIYILRLAYTWYRHRILRTTGQKFSFYTHANRHTDTNAKEGACVWLRRLSLSRAFWMWRALVAFAKLRPEIILECARSQHRRVVSAIYVYKQSIACADA